MKKKKNHRNKFTWKPGDMTSREPTEEELAKVAANRIAAANRAEGK